MYISVGLFFCFIFLVLNSCWLVLEFHLGLGYGLDLDSSLRIEPNKLHGLQTGKELDLEV